MKAFREQLPILEKIHYFNYAKAGPLLLDSAEKLKELAELAKEPFELHQDIWKKHLTHAREVFAHFIGAKSDEIALTESTSSGLSLIASSIRWKQGDRILYPADEYPSNRFVWDNLEGVITEAIEPQKGVLFSEQLETMDLKNVRLVAVSAVSFWDGRRHDVENISQICKKHNILFSVDAIQAAGTIPIDVNLFGCDFLASGGQKWLFGPVGTGFVYFNRRVIPELRVPRMGWGSIKPLTNYLSSEFEFADGAKRFETGHGNISGFAALANSIETMKAIGWESIYSRIKVLIEKAEEELKSLNYLPIVKGFHSGIVVFETPDATKIQQALEKKKIYTTARSNRLRISFHASVKDEDLQALFQSLRTLL